MTRPAANPFAGEEFARVWDGWRGRRCRALEAGGQRTMFVERSLGPLCTRAALPYGIPVFLDDHEPGRHVWLRSFFTLPRCVRSSASLFDKPRHDYKGVRWHTTDRSLVTLDDRWWNRLDNDVRRRAQRAREAGWQVTELDAEALAAWGVAFAETDRRHEQQSRFDLPFVQHLRRELPDPDRLRLIAAHREAEAGALHVILAAGDYEFSWSLVSTDRARSEGIIPFLTLAWFEAAQRRGCRLADLGASPSAGVTRFKQSFGAETATHYTGVRRWHLAGGHT